MQDPNTPPAMPSHSARAPDGRYVSRDADIQREIEIAAETLPPTYRPYVFEIARSIDTGSYTYFW